MSATNRMEVQCHVGTVAPLSGFKTACKVEILTLVLMMAKPCNNNSMAWNPKLTYPCPGLDWLGEVLNCTNKRVEANLALNNIFPIILRFVQKDQSWGVIFNEPIWLIWRG